MVTILIEFDTYILVTADRRVMQLDERDIRTKLNLLFKHSLYDIALRMAKSNQFDDEGLAEVCKKYGDHLAQRGKHQGTIQTETAYTNRMCVMLDNNVFI